MKYSNRYSSKYEETETLLEKIARYDGPIVEKILMYALNCVLCFGLAAVLFFVLVALWPC